jgi:hypothetical protein
LFPTVTVPITLLDFGSILATVFLGPLEIQTDSSIAIQSGAPGTSKTASGLSAVIAIRTPGAFTPGLGVCAGFWACVREDMRISETMMSSRLISRILSKTSCGYLWPGHFIGDFQIRLPCRGVAFELSPAFMVFEK